MRPLLAICVAFCVLGGLGFYLQVLQSQPERIVLDEPEASAAGSFSLELILTFDAGPDAFAFDIDSAPSVLVQFKGTELVAEKEPVAAGQPIRVNAIDGIVPGANEFFVQVTPQDQSDLIARAVRLRVRRDDLVVADQTLWSEPGESIQGTVTLLVETPGSSRHGSHLHE